MFKRGSDIKCSRNADVLTSGKVYMAKSDEYSFAGKQLVEIVNDKGKVCPINASLFELVESGITDKAIDETVITSVTCNIENIHSETVISVAKDCLCNFNGLELGPGDYTKEDINMLQDDSEGEKVYAKAGLEHEQAVVDTLLTPPNERSWLLRMAKLP